MSWERYNGWKWPVGKPIWSTLSTCCGYSSIRLFHLYVRLGGGGGRGGCLALSSLYCFCIKVGKGNRERDSGRGLTGKSSLCRGLESKKGCYFFALGLKWIWCWLDLLRLYFPRVNSFCFIQKVRQCQPISNSAFCISYYVYEEEGDNIMKIPHCIINP